MNIAIACGGTGGHIFPGLAVAAQLEARGHAVVLWLAGKKIESTAIRRWHGPVITVRAEGLSLGTAVRMVTTVLWLPAAVALCAARMRKSRPDVLLAMGSYASVPPALAAALLRVPVVLHEANAVPGRAMKFLARFATVIAVHFDRTRAFFPGKRCVLAGYPVRAEIARPSGTRLLPPGLFTLLVTGGSQGAHAVNELVSQAVCVLWSRGLKLQVIHQSGTADEAVVRNRYANAGVPHVVAGFLDDMGNAYASADFAICRAGGGTCAELAAAGVPALLIPLPGAPCDHQTENAKAMEETGLVRLLAQEHLGVERLADYMEKLLKDPAGMAKMKSAGAVLSTADAAGKLADVVESAAKKPA